MGVAAHPLIHTFVEIHVVLELAFFLDLSSEYISKCWEGNSSHFVHDMVPSHKELVQVMVLDNDTREVIETVH